MMNMNNTTDVSETAVFLNNVIVLMWYVVSPFLLVFGTFGNVMTVVVMRGMRASQSTACLSVYFTALALSDQCLLIVGVVWYGVEATFTWPPSFFYLDIMCTVPYFVLYACSLTSAWFLVAMTFQRVTSVVVPHRVAVLCTVRRGKIVTVIFVIVACAINVHLLFTFTYNYEQRQCSYKEKYVDFIDMFTLLDVFLASAIPFVLLIIGNCVLVRQVIQSVSFSQKMQKPTNKETAADGHKVGSMTMTLILTSAAFLILTLPICILLAYSRALNFDTMSEESLARFDLVKTLCLFLGSGANASNFYLYLLSGSRFRQETKRYLCWNTNQNA